MSTTIRTRTHLVALHVEGVVEQSVVPPPGDLGERPPPDGLAPQPHGVADLVGTELQAHLLPAGAGGEDPRLLGRHCGRRRGGRKEVLVSASVNKSPLLILGKKVCLWLDKTIVQKYSSGLDAHGLPKLTDTKRFTQPLSKGDPQRRPTRRPNWLSGN